MKPTWTWNGAGAVAKGAQIIYVNSTNVFTSYYYAIDNRVAPVISLSYGLCEFEDNRIAADETELMKGNSEGITFLNSSGDSGAAECDPNTPYSPSTDPNGASAQGGVAVSYPASSPEVTGVGGTSLSLTNTSASQYWGASNGTDGGTALSYIPEQAWNDDAEFAEYCQQNPGQFCSQGGNPAVPGWVPITNAQNVQTDFSLQGGQGISSSGGGASNCAVQNANNSACVSGFPQPSWQKVTVPGQPAVRFTPDVSLLASPNFPGYIFCTQLSELGDSGTGSACGSGGSAGITSAVNLSNPSIIGGTSVSTPIFAGIVALLNQYLASSGLGNINPTLYSLAATPSNGAFHPVTAGGSDNNNLVYCTAGTPSVQPAGLRCPSSGVLGFQASDADATTGYNLVTGLGSVDAARLAAAMASFTLTPTASSFTVSQGANIDVTINVAFNNGFTGTVTFTCTDPAPQSTCTFPNSSINAAGPVTAHITTVAPTVGSLQHFDHGSGIVYAALLPGLLGLVFTAGSRRSLRGVRLLGLIVVLGFSTLWLASCGNANASGGTKKGNYAITVKGTSGATSSSTTFQLVVQ